VDGHLARGPVEITALQPDDLTTTQAAQATSHHKPARRQGGKAVVLHSVQGSDELLDRPHCHRWTLPRTSQGRDSFVGPDDRVRARQVSNVDGRDGIGGHDTLADRGVERGSQSGTDPIDRCRADRLRPARPPLGEQIKARLGPRHGQLVERPHTKSRDQVPAHVIAVTVHCGWTQGWLYDAEPVAQPSWNGPNVGRQSIGGRVQHRLPRVESLRAAAETATALCGHADRRRLAPARRNTSSRGRGRRGVGNVPFRLLISHPYSADRFAINVPLTRAVA
jgi:hypothetical protein